MELQNLGNNQRFKFDLCPDNRQRTQHFPSWNLAGSFLLTQCLHSHAYGILQTVQHHFEIATPIN